VSPRRLETVTGTKYKFTFGFGLAKVVFWWWLGSGQVESKAAGEKHRSPNLLSKMF